ncbi:hypothetical protein GCM10022261_25140 [Brevibacterium daeguense]|uniref:ARB-07466-like C-terminal domain-containing protein n=1 Tax=Brevibacterium daeguense TaxID=909936 RepID=A0ABP8EMN0_9MICO|nr:ligand-binding protein SH3 [Brevibacterium daeguense]
MGKHTDPQPNWGANARTLLRDLSNVGRKSSGRHSQEPNTATGVLKTVRRRPMVAAIALPAAATTAIVASSIAFAPSQNEGVVKAENQTSSASAEPGAEDSPTQSEEALEEERQKAAEEYWDSLKDDPKYTSKSEAKAALPEPEPSESEDTSGSGAGKSGDSKSGEGKSGEGKSDKGSASGEDGTSDRGSKSSRSEARGSGGSGGVSNEPCSVSSSIESGISANATKGYRAVCAEFPEVNSYGGLRGGSGSSDHHSGNAVDIMITGSTGDRITDFLIKHKSELNVKYVIWEQKIFAPYTGWEGRAMEDRGSATANHYDHVHVSFN